MAILPQKIGGERIHAAEFPRLKDRYSLTADPGDDKAMVVTHREVISPS